MDDVLEIVTFKTKPGVSDAQVLSAADGLQREVERLDGYRARRLLKTDDGTWVDMVWWTTLEAAHAAAQTIETQPIAQTFMEIADAQSIRMLHARPVKEYKEYTASDEQIVAGAR